MSDPPPRPPRRPVTTADLDACEERLEVHTSVFVDERLYATEQRLLSGLRAGLGRQTRVLLLALAVVFATLAVLIIAAPVP